MEAPFIDIHTHPSPEKLYATCFYSFGIHPWWLHGEDENNPRLEDGERPSSWQLLEDLLRENRLAAIGETGIDRIHEDTLPRQVTLFEQQILLSEHYQKPLIIHDVRGTDVILQMHKKHQPHQTWIIHGFNGTESMIQQLTRRGICLSVGKSILYDHRKISKTITSIPLDYLFLETDTSAFPIQKIYEIVSERLNLPLEKLKEKIFANFARLKLTSWKTGETAHDCSSATMALINLERAMC